jgi:ATP-binding protein involved in chromosome partitioning
MSIHICSKCGHAEHIFGSGGGERMAKDYAVELLGALPLDMAIRLQMDGGTPTVEADPEGLATKVYKGIARRVAVKIAERAKDHSSKFPSIVVQNT